MTDEQTLKLKYPLYELRGEGVGRAELEEEVESKGCIQRAEPHIRADERKRVLEELAEWLGSDDEYEVLEAIRNDLKANPQLVPEQDVPLRLLQALRAAVSRFALAVEDES